MTGILLKLQPNQDLTTALEDAVAAGGLGQARIVAAVGSLVEAVVRGPCGIERIEGPAIEVAALTGMVRAGGGSRLHAYMIRQDMSVVEGELVAGRNPVAVTFELLMEAEAGRC